ncbi:MAG: SDR family NAD(P)-dependent oxidoreductase, partial [Oscillospiraceae bacterium]|nr:SDR family NAD(P)-dependent oxidoreductase [Oscillospiraceae bacterium]
MADRAIVTGGSRGIGAQCARALRRDGFDVTVCYNDSREAALALAREIGASAVRADMRATGDVERLFAAAGGADLLVCCAGIAGRALLTDMSEDEWLEL